MSVDSEFDANWKEEVEDSVGGYSSLSEEAGERNGKFCQNGKFSQNSKFGQNGKLGHSCTKVTKSKLNGSWDSDHAIVHLGLNVSSSAHNCGCVVDGGKAMAAI